MTRIVRLLSILLLAATFMVGDFKVPVFDGPSVAYAQKKKKRGFFQRLFGTRKKKKTVVVPPPSTVTKKKTKKRNRHASEARRKATAALPKLEDSNRVLVIGDDTANACLLYTSPSPRDQRGSRMPSSA